MKAGDRVRVYPHGSPEEAAIGTVDLYAEGDKGAAIAISFEDKPQFVRFLWPDDGMMMLTLVGCIPMFAYRLSVGPWIEMGREGHYEIEPAPASGFVWEA